LTKPVSDIRLRKIIEEKGILIVKVPRSKLDQNANLLGSFIITGIKQAALSLANEQSEKHHQVALYLDELEHFVEKETVNTICSETEGFRIGLVGCIKTLQHLDENFRNVLIAMNTICTFALARKDAELLGPQTFSVDGRKKKHITMQNFFNQVNTSPQFEPVADEKELNIKRLDAQEDRTFYCHKVGTVGVFHMRAHEFSDILDTKVNKKIIDKMRGRAENKKNNQEKESKKTNKASKEGKEEKPASKGKKQERD
jgi:hypothetical protein